MTLTSRGTVMLSTNLKILIPRIKSPSNGPMLPTVSLLPLTFLEHFIVWMRTSGLPNFRKLYGVIGQNLVAGTYQLNINNSYAVASFGGHKTFVLSTTNALGGKNYFMAICYLAAGSACIIFAIVFFTAFMCRKVKTNN